MELVIDQYFSTVRPMHLEFVATSKKHADIIIPEGYKTRAPGHRCRADPIAHGLSIRSIHIIRA